MMLTVVTLPWRSLYDMEVMRMLTAVNALAAPIGPGLSISTSWAGLAGWAGLGGEGREMAGDPGINDPRRQG